MALLNFDATRVEPSTVMEALPAGQYLVEITKSETKETKAKNGSYLELEMTVLEGDYRGRKLWDRLCLQHVNQKTQAIARANLSALCHAVNILKPKDSIELHDLPFMVTVKTRENDVTGEIYNEIRGYAKRERAVTGDSTTTAGDNTAPWAR